VSTYHASITAGAFIEILDGLYLTLNDSVIKHISQNSLENTTKTSTSVQVLLNNEWCAQPCDGSMMFWISEFCSCYAPFTDLLTVMGCDVTGDSISQYVG